jgi:phosphoribosylformimino-5-aminoimidazole carboxamide ribotide isomerase
MRVIGVVDLLGGRAVRARGGRRAEYEPVRQVGHSTVRAGDAVAVARAYIDELGLRELYVADLDAILGAEPQTTIVSDLASLVERLWLDAGVTTVDRARAAVDLGARYVVVGLETLSSFEALDAICAGVGGDRVAFSLDLRHGEPVVSSASVGITGESATRLAARAASSNVGSVIVLDLARVGTAVGIDLPLVERVREAAPDVALIAGGGVRGSEDLRRLAEAGCQGALVASALQDGDLSASNVAAAVALQPSVSR